MVPEDAKFYCSARDITFEVGQIEDLKRAEEGLRQAQKMEAVGCWQSKDKMSPVATSSRFGGFDDPADLIQAPPVFAPEVIRHAVFWLYFRFSLSIRDVEEMMSQRGVDVDPVLGE